MFSSLPGQEAFRESGLGKHLYFNFSTGQRTQVTYRTENTTEGPSLSILAELD